MKTPKPVAASKPPGRNGQTVIVWGSFSGAGNHDAPRGAKRKPQTDLTSNARRGKMEQSFHRRARRQTEPPLKAKQNQANRNKVGGHFITIKQAITSARGKPNEAILALKRPINTC
jgi:hypothetical protein